MESVQRLISSSITGSCGFLHARLSAEQVPFRGIIHVAGISLFWRASRASIQGSVISAMRVVEAQGFRSVAFPIVGAGTGGFDQDSALRVMLDAFAMIESRAEVVIVRFRGGGGQGHPAPG